MSDQDEESSGAPSFSRYEQLYAGHSTMELVAALARVRGEKDEQDKRTKEVGAEHEYLAKVLIPTRFNDEGIKNMNVDGIGRISLRSDIYASVKAGMKEQSFAWLRDAGKGDLIQAAVAPSTLKAVLKQMLKDGEEYPESIYNVTPYQTATITKA